MKILSAIFAALLVSSAAVAQTTGPSTGTPAQHVVCDSGCGSPPASADGTAFTAGVTNVSLIGAAFNDALAALTAGKYAAPRMNQWRALHVICSDYTTGVSLPYCPVSISGAVQLTPNGDTPFITELLGSDGLTPIENTGTSLNVACTAGCSVGAPGQATMANSAPVVIASNQSAVPISGNIVVDSGNIVVDSGIVNVGNTGGGNAVNIQDGGNSITVDGTVTVTDGAGALNVIVDSGTTTVTQATGTNLHAVIDSGAVTVSDGAGALNVIVDSGTLTTVSTVTAVTAITNALPAGSNIIGNVRIDQTTPGTTNAVQANAGTNLNTSLLALETTQVTGNASLASIKTNTDPLVTAGAGGYVRQDSTATIAKETGGNLATIAALSKAEDATHNTGDPGVQWLGVRNENATVLSSAEGDYGSVAVDSHGHTFSRVVGQQNGTENVAIVSPSGAQVVTFMQPAALPLFPCNAVRRLNCQR